MRFPLSPIDFIYRIYRYVLPEVHHQWLFWKRNAEQIPDAELRKQALASLEQKKFHCQGGSVYASAVLPVRRTMIPLVVQLQTISDYLDNLCDRSTSMDPQDFRQLHMSLLDAVDPEGAVHDYYRFHPERDDGGYLEQLVKRSQEALRELVSYEKVAGHVKKLVGLYCDLQVHKHTHPGVREQRLADWWQDYQKAYPDILWNEFAAATGSTLGVFTLLMLAAESDLTIERVEQIVQAYFPWVCGLHILLDYLIDREEDCLGGDLNFTTYYRDEKQTAARLKRLYLMAKRRLQALPDSRLHRMIVDGLLGLYLSDRKVWRQRYVLNVAKKLLFGPHPTVHFFYLNSLIFRGRYDLTQPARSTST
jgi:tetraprenyl-beta-curcumene synthase